MLLRSIDKRILTFWIISVVVSSASAVTYYQLDPWLSLLGASSIMTFIAMGIDKFQAIQKGKRLSERSLYLMTFLGGSIGMLIGMYVFRHKSNKQSFQLVVAFVVLVQLLLSYYLFKNDLTILL
jgi:uncharacterized membrane protein YsdA (DUF1294 family)